MQVRRSMCCTRNMVIPPVGPTMMAGQRLGLPVVVSIQGGDGHWVGSCCETHRQAMVRVLDHADAVLIGGESFAREVHERLGTADGSFYLRTGRGRYGAVYARHARRRTLPCAFFITGASIAGKACSISSRRRVALDRQLACNHFRHRSRFRRREVAWSPKARLGDRIVFTGYADYARRAADIPCSITSSPRRPMPKAFRTPSSKRWRSGLAIVSCHAVGVSDCLRDGENGMLVRAGRYRGAGRRPAATDRRSRRHASGWPMPRWQNAAKTYSWDVVGG